MNNYTKYGLIFLGGVALGALGAMAISRGVVSFAETGEMVPDGNQSSVGGDVEVAGFEIVVAEAQLKNQEKKTAQEAQEAAQTVQEAVVEKTPA